MKRHSECSNCTFWLGMTYPRGECHRHAPRAQLFLRPGDIDRPGWSAPDTASRPPIWPGTEFFDFCGEWEERP
jgi:hypothetical protein